MMLRIKEVDERTSVYQPNFIRLAVERGDSEDPPRPRYGKLQVLVQYDQDSDGRYCSWEDVEVVPAYFSDNETLSHD